MSDVRMLPGAHRPEGALSWLSELLARGDTRGVIVIAASAEGNVEPRVFGDVRRFEFAFAGCVLSDHSISGDFE